MIDIPVGKSERGISFGGKPCRAVFIPRYVFFKAMLKSVYFYYQPFLKTYKIYDIVPNWLLAVKFIPTRLTHTKPLPQDAFFFCGVASQGFRQICKS